MESKKRHIPQQETATKPGALCKLPILLALLFTILGPKDNAQAQVVDQSILDKYAFKYEYDGRRRMIEKKVPGAKSVQLYYDTWDRLVLTQDGNQRGAELNNSDNQYTYTKYDILNRPIITGIATITTAPNQLREDIMAMTGTERYENRDDSDTETGYTNNNSYPTTTDITQNEVLTVTYYDNRNFSFGSQPEFVFVEELGLTTADDLFNRNKGQVTGSKTKVLEEDRWIRSINYYDDRYRLIQTISDDPRAGTDAYIRTTNTYDFVGNLTQSQTTYTNEDLSFKDSYTYDHADRLMQVDQEIIQSGTAVSNNTILENTYNELGELIDKKLHVDQGTGEAFQSVDYRYNIRGWLKSINNHTLSQADNNDDDNDLFGMELYYESGFEIPQYNGNISGVKWGSVADPDNPKAYGFNYDPMNRLTFADYSEGPGFTGGEDKYRIDHIDYDLNGNIEELVRFGAPDNEQAEVIDLLDYDYDGNQLQSVTDGGNIEEGFKDGHTSTTEADYQYDANGNMVEDKNKNITAISYNHLNLPTTVTFQDNKAIKYIYDASGIKLRQEVYEDGIDQPATKTTDYIGNLIFENDALQFAQHQEGRIIPKENSAWEYQYNLTDHLGNVRMVATTEPEVEELLATMESANASTEESIFLNMDDNVPYFAANSTPGATSTYAARVNSQNPIGPGTLLKVYPGDIVEMSTTAYYDDYDQNAEDLPFGEFVGALVNSYDQVVAGGEAASQLFSSLNAAIGAVGVGGHQTDEVPGGYLNYIFLDKDYQFDEEGPHPLGFCQLTTAAEQDHEQITLPPVTIEKEGYLLVYVSNESNTQNYVHFDDLKITHTSSPVVQSTDYYPFGLAHGNGFSREDSPQNSFLYNSFELQDELNLGWYDYLARQYDPAIGRFTSVDPAADLMRRFSSYTYAYDNPVRFIDPDGMFGTDVVITGSASDEAFDELQASVSSELTLSKDEKGKVTYTKVGEGELSKNAQQLTNAIDDHSIVVNVKAENTTTTESGNLYIGGAFSGNEAIEVQDDVHIVLANQEVNPEVLSTMSDAHENPGADMLHEVTEAYQGALISQKKGQSSPASNQKGTVYDKAHKRATNQSGSIFERIYDGAGKELQMLPGNVYPSGVKSADWYVNDKKGNKVIIQRLK
ncbi:MAG: RHS repeat-associated core domain-containing protein [Bacteroidota bacterium]